MIFKIKIDNSEHQVEIEELTNNKIKVKLEGKEHLVEIEENVEIKIEKTKETINKEIKAPMPGIISNVFFHEKELVKKGTTLLTLIAMKMENKIISPRDGKIEEIKVKSGDIIETGQVLIILK